MLKFIKRKIAMLLSIALLLSFNAAFDINVNANNDISKSNSEATLLSNSNNNISINKHLLVNSGDFIDDAYLRIIPTAEVDMDSKIILKIENGVFDEECIEKQGGLDKYQYKELGSSEYCSYDGLKKDYIDYMSDYTSTKAFDNVFDELMREWKTVNLPYKLKRLSDTEMEVTLFALPDSLAGAKYADINILRYKIPLPFKATGGNVKLSIDSVNTSISNTELTIAKDINSDEDYVFENGSLNTINKVLVLKNGEFDDYVYLRIQPNFEVDMDSKIILKIENGVFDEECIEKQGGLDKYQYKALGRYEYTTYDSFKKEYLDYMRDYNSTKAFDNVFDELMREWKTVDLPYKLKRLSDTEMEVTLFALPDSLAGAKYADVGTPRYRIPIPFTAKGNKNLYVNTDSKYATDDNTVVYTKISIETPGTSISPDSFYIANVIIDNDTEETTNTETSTTTEETTNTETSEDTSFIFGDADTDGGITSNDAAVLLNYILDSQNNLPLKNKTADFEKYIDVDKSGSIDARDVSNILEKALNEGFIFKAEIK